MGKFWREYWEQVAVGVVVAAAVATYSAGVVGLPQRYNSPDEAANAFFARRVAAGQGLAVPAPRNQVAGEPIVHPRSTLVLRGSLAPASFLGFPLVAGFLAGVFGFGLLPFITPLASVIGLLSFYGLIKRLSGTRAALVGVLLLAALPAFWYYHSRSFFHNALFFDLLLLAAYLLDRALVARRYLLYLAAGLALGLALALRTSEVFWVLTAGSVWLAARYHELYWRGLILATLGALFAFSPVFVANYQLYGSVLSVGYQQNLVVAGAGFRQTASLMGELVLPFGFHPSHIAGTVGSFLLSLTWWWTLMVLAGTAYLAYHWRELTRAERNFAAVVAVVGVWLITVYGSWRFHDNPDPSQVTLGTSYQRYWLPFTALALWPAARACAGGLKLRWGKYVAVSVIGCFVVLSWNLVLNEPQEGLRQVRANVRRFESTAQAVRALVPEGSVIVSGITDKFFWPERDVVLDLVRPADYRAVERLLARNVPVFWFHPTWVPSDLARVNQRLSYYGLELVPGAHGFQGFSLYVFLPTP